MSARAMVSTHLVQGESWWAREPRRRYRVRGWWRAWTARRARTARPAEVTAPADAAPAAPAQGPVADAAGELVPTPRHRSDVVDLREDDRWAALADQAGDLVAAGPRHRR